VTIEFAGGGLTAKSQVQDYALRGHELEEMSLIFFLVNTYEERIPEGERHRNSDEGTQTTALESDITRGPLKSARGRPKHERSHYLPSHPRSEECRRTARTAGHNVLPNIIGRYFPRRDDPEMEDLYSASMLALLKPWRNLQTLKSNLLTWRQAFDIFIAAAPKRVQDIVSNIQYYYDCEDAASLQRHNGTSKDGKSCKTDLNEDGNESEQDMEEGGLTGEHQVTEEDIEQVVAAQIPWRELAHGRQALELAKSANIFLNDEETWKVEQTYVGNASGDDLLKLSDWQRALTKDATSYCADSNKAAAADVQIDHGDVLFEENVYVEERPGNGRVETITEQEIGEEPLTSINPQELFEEQHRAFEIIDWHLHETIAGRMPPQLLMHVLGEGGVGKSKVIQTVTDDFTLRLVRDWLVKAAYTGIAASIIGGSTLHTVALLPRNGKPQSAQTEKKLAQNWAKVRYLIIDEISMVSRDLFARLSRIISKAKAVAGEHRRDEPFGGLNVIIFGDLHQFPPVAGRASAPLYYPINQSRDTEDEINGRILYEQFRIVVKLRRQVRVTDPEWMDLLRHGRHGACNDKHLKMMRSLILSHADCPPVDFSQPPWDNAVLVTPRHAVRVQWNNAAVAQHCSRTKQQLFTSVAEDSIRGRGLTLQERFIVASKRKRGGGKSRCEKGSLSATIQLAIGMKVMVTFNVKTELDIANGARGEVTNIVLDEREPPVAKDAAKFQLKYPPAYVLVKLQRTKAAQLRGLPEGVVPIVPMVKKFSIQVGKHQRTVTRTQLPITAAYAFTDYRSQGQSIPCVIVDIATPPTGGLTPFNAYVQLSRSSGSSTIRLLRDFDNKLFTQHPSEFLRLEDLRLENLDKKTMQWWDERSQRRQVMSNDHVSIDGGGKDM
jgi:PIF1-like helicase